MVLEAGVTEYILEELEDCTEYKVIPLVQQSTYSLVIAYTKRTRIFVSQPKKNHKLLCAVCSVQFAIAV